jgi:hypothetical protein
MDRLFKGIGILMIGLLSFVWFEAFALAQNATPLPLPIEIPPVTESDIKAFLAALGGAETIGTMGIIAIIVQALILFAKSTIGKFAGKWQLTLVMVLTFIGGILGLKMNGMDWGSVLIHSSTITAAQVLFYQLYKQFVANKNE